MFKTVKVDKLTAHDQIIHNLLLSKEVLLKHNHDQGAMRLIHTGLNL